MGDTLTLSETSPIWTRDTALGVGRRFVIRIPPDPAPAGFDGTWTFGQTRGTLHLDRAAPW